MNSTKKTTEELFRAQHEFKNFRLVHKADSKFMALLYYVSLMFIWNKRFMTSYITTIGHTIYITQHVEDFGKHAVDYVVLKHELQHMRDAQQEGTLLWSLKYLFPQVLAPLCLLGLLWWPLVFFVLAALPWPAPWRVLSEVRGYAVSAHVWSLITSTRTPSRYVDRYEKYFTGWEYYKMAWKWAPVRKKMIEAVEQLMKEEEETS